MRNVGTARAAASVVLVGLDADAMGMVRETLAAEAVLPNSSISFGDAIGARCLGSFNDVHMLSSFGALGPILQQSLLISTILVPRATSSLH